MPDHFPDFLILPEFHQKNPDKVLVRKDGTLTRKLSFAHPEVRARKVAIADEILGYGLDGIMVGALRHPPMALYEPALVDAFKKKHGEDPLKMDGDGTEAWLRFRADAFTQFLRELREMMDKKGRNLELAVRTRHEPWLALRDGCDVEAWMREGLVDTVIASYWGANAGSTPQTIDITAMRRLTREKARLIALVWRLGDMTTAASLANQAYSQGAEGVAFYESDMLVLVPERRRDLRVFRSHDTLRQWLRERVGLEE